MSSFFQGMTVTAAIIGAAFCLVMFGRFVFWLFAKAAEAALETRLRRVESNVTEIKRTMVHESTTNWLERRIDQSVVALKERLDILEQPKKKRLKRLKKSK